MKKCLKTAKINLLIVTVIAIAVGCTNRDKVYDGEYPELYTAAIHSLLGSTGYIQSERSFPAIIKEIDEDAYARKLFIYYEGSHISTYSLMISQKSDDEYTYFYPDYNFISVEESKWQHTATLGPPEDDFTTEEIEELKRNNDWNKPINIDRCIKAKIVREKEMGQIEYKELEKLYYETLGENAGPHPRHRIHFLVTDNYGRSVYLLEGNSEAATVIVFQPDGSYEEHGIMELKELQNYQDELKEFKELNGWNEQFISK